MTLERSHHLLCQLLTSFPLHLSTKKCRRKKLLEDPELQAFVRDKFLTQHWSPEQIAGRLKLEESALAVHQGKQAGPTQFAKNGIRFPIAKPRTCIGSFRALANIVLNLQLSPFILAVFAAPGFPLMPQLSFGSTIASRFALCGETPVTENIYQA